VTVLDFTFDIFANYKVFFFLKKKNYYSYSAFDEHEEIEIACNQAKLYDLLQSPKDLERLLWDSSRNKNIDFVTEISGT